MAASAVGGAIHREPDIDSHLAGVGIPRAEISRARIERGREVIRLEELALQRLLSSLDESFSSAVDMLLACRGSVVVTGMGKAGIVGQKISASLASTGTPSHFLHPGEAVHGDLGRVRPEDVILLLSASGETEEIVRLLPYLRKQADKTLAITCRGGSSLARGVHLCLVLGETREACANGLAPSTSTTLMIALGDALALVTSEARGFTSQQFARFHPAGSLGRQLTNVREVMRPLSQCRVALDSLSVREAIVDVSLPGRRTGAIMLVNSNGQLSGIFTDSDLARLLEHGAADPGVHELDQPMAQVMSRQYQTLAADSFLPEAISKLTEFKISELPVIDEQGCPLGLIDITDLLAVVPANAVASAPENKFLESDDSGLNPAATEPVEPGQAPEEDGESQADLSSRSERSKIIPMHRFVSKENPDQRTP